MSNFSINYLGSAEPKDLAPRELVAILSSLDQICSSASATLYGSIDEPPFRIRKIMPGSISIEGLISVIAGLQPGFAHLPALSFGIESVPKLVKAWFDLMKFLKGKPPQSVQKVGDGNAVCVTNNSGNTTVINHNVYNTFVLHDISRKARKLKIPVTRGANALQIVEDGKEFARYPSQDLENFNAIESEDDFTSEVDAILEIRVPVLDGSGLWRFKYGNSNLAAKITDEEFLARVTDKSERFARGDRFLVKLRTTQRRDGAKLKTDHSVMEVIRRIAA